MFRPRPGSVVVASMAAWLCASVAGASTIAVPSYFYPGALWTQMENAFPTVGLSIINPNSGPGTASDANYVTQVNHTRARGLHVLGYVRTTYAARAAADTKADIDRYFAWYAVDGIFLDEASNVCTNQPYYVDLNNYIKSKGGIVTVLNPGTNTAECYTSAGDILLTFESTYAAYQSYALSGWEQNYPASRFWHLIYQTPQANVGSAVARANSLHAGWVYATPDDLPNPWDTLPSGTYWTDELTAVQSTSSTPVPTATATTRPRATATATTRPQATATATSTGASGTLLSQGKPATASSVENAGSTANLAVDGNTGTRWSSAFTDPQWITVDLGTTASITRVVLNWEAAYGKTYQIQVSANNSTWTTVVNVTAGDGGIDDLAATGSGRYVRMYGTARATGYGYSLWEMQVYGTAGGATATATATARPTATATATARSTATATARPAGGVLVSQGKPATASSSENAGTTANLAVDGSTTTRWSSAFSDPQWIMVDLGATTAISRVVLNWEAAYGKAYQIQASADGSTWTTLFTETAGNGGLDDLAVSGSGRYVRMYGTARGTGYGYSLWELQVFN
jgi:hypothetical protein